MYRELLQSGIQVKIIGDGVAAGSGSSDDDRSGPVILTVGEGTTRNNWVKSAGRPCSARMSGGFTRPAGW